MEELIMKEEIPHLRVVAAPEDHSKELMRKLDYATRLGNEFKAKSNIVFQTDSGPKRVETTIWAHDENYLQLKNGIILPLRSLIDVNY